jgi:hypothetical protein
MIPNTKKIKDAISSTFRMFGSAWNRAIIEIYN